MFQIRWLYHRLCGVMPSWSSMSQNSFLWQNRHAKYKSNSNIITKKTEYMYIYIYIYMHCIYSSIYIIIYIPELSLSGQLANREPPDQHNLLVDCFVVQPSTFQNSQHMVHVYYRHFTELLSTSFWCFCRFTHCWCLILHHVISVLFYPVSLQTFYTFQVLVLHNFSHQGYLLKSEITTEFSRLCSRGDASRGCEDTNRTFHRPSGRRPGSIVPI